MATAAHVPIWQQRPSLNELQSQRRATFAEALAAKTCERCGGPIARRYASERRFCGRRCAAAYRADQKRKPRATCALCGKTAPNPRQRACSAKCAYTLRKLKTRPPRSCRVCGKQYFHKGRVRLKFCSRRCYHIEHTRESWLSTTCTACQKPITVRRLRKKTALRFCSRECRMKFFVDARNPMWRGTQDPNRGSGWKRLAASIRKRDGYVCQRCGRTQVENGGSLDVDHVRPWRSFENKAEANDPSNLVSLCKKCHCHKTSSIERRWLKGDGLAMQQYERSLALSAEARL